MQRSTKKRLLVARTVCVYRPRSLQNRCALLYDTTDNRRGALRQDSVGLLLLLLPAMKSWSTEARVYAPRKGCTA